MALKLNPITGKLDLDGGAAGAAGVGVPTGGAANEVLAKIDGTDYNTHWVANSGGGTWTDTSTNSGTNKTLNDKTNYIDSDATHLKTYNNLGGPATVGMPVYGGVWNGANSAVEVSKAKADSSTTLPCIGLVEIAGSDSTVSEVRTSGLLNNVNTNTWSEGTILYVSPSSAGTLTSTKPSGATEFVQSVGTVLRQHLTLGIIEVNCSDVVSLSALRGTNTGDQTLSGLGGVAANVAITGATNTKITYDAKGLVTSGTSATASDVGAEPSGAVSTHAALSTGVHGAGVNSLIYSNDSRLTDSRTPTSHNQAESTITFTDITTGNASTTSHGFEPKAVAPAANTLNVMGIANGETVTSNKLILDQASTPTTQAFSDAASIGTSLVAAHADHKHAFPASPKDTTAVTGILKGNGTTVSAATNGTDYIAPGTAVNGNLIFTDATYDIGATGATRPRNEYLSGGIAVATATATNGVVNTATGFRIGNVAAAGKILVGDGTNFIASTPTYPNSASPTARKIIVADGTNWTASTETWATPGTAGSVLVSNGTNWVASGDNTNTAQSAAINTTETVLVKNGTAFPASRLLSGTTIRAVFDGINTSTVGNASTFALRYGTNGTTADGLLCTGAVTSAASGTSVPFRAILEVTLYTVGATTTGNGMLTVINQGTTGISTTATTVVVGTMTSINTTTASTFVSATYKSAAATTTSTFNNVTLEFIK